MIEIAFHDSAIAGLKMAQKSEGVVACAVGVILSHADGSQPVQEEIDHAQHEAEEQIRRNREQMIPLGGDPRNVFGFTLYLSIGDITESIPGLKRAATISALWNAYDTDMTNEAQAMVTQAHQTLDTVLARLHSGEKMRIWYSNNPDELCAFHWLMAQLYPCCDALNGQITAIKLPVYDVVSANEVRHHTGCGELSPGDYHRFLPLEQPITPILISIYHNIWRTLQEENAPLRAQINGQLRSVPIDLYDSFIRREISRMPDEFREALLIGNVLGRHELGISDSFIAQRIETMLRAGELAVVSTPPGTVYRRILRKARI